MMDFAHIIAQAQEMVQSSQAAPGMLEGLLSQLGISGMELGTGGTAAALAVVWYCVRIIRRVVSILFSLCILLLLLQLLGVVDASSVVEAVSGWLGSAGAGEVGGA